MGRGRPINRSLWPTSGPQLRWLEFLDRTHRANGMPSLRVVAKAMHLAAATRAGDLLRGKALPTDAVQARALVTALGGVDHEVDRGVRLYEQAQGSRMAKINESTGWWQRSWYIEQVRDIAPQILLARDVELGELAAFCAGDEPYVYWQAEAWAGKSALMSWFVLHPPRDTWVVSFFVTARLAAQSDSSAFADALLDQLSAITGESLPPVVTPSSRDALQRRLMAAAIVRARQSGRRLVLVVDGIDEDCGVRPRSGLASIASLLPRVIDNDLRVVVAGRPDPPVSRDVAVDHPLRVCRRHPLTPSSHARRTSELARHELDELLAANHSDPTGVGREVLGLVTACGGGLTRGDLVELTRRASFEIDTLLAGMFGRTVARRTDAVTIDGCQVYVFTHETLRIEASDRLGPAVLAGYRARIIAWARSYQRQKWPAVTPIYLLRSLPRMLLETDDLTELVALATDSDRHNWMLDITGGDAAAFAEIRSCQDLILRDDEPDLTAMSRLAIYRGALEKRIAHAPTKLPAIWAELGHSVRAEALARSVFIPAVRAEVFASVAEAMSDPGQCDRARTLVAEAEAIVRAITDPFKRAWGLAALVAALATAGEHDRASVLAAEVEAIVGTMTEPFKRAWGLAAAVAALVTVGEHDRAEILAAEAAKAARNTGAVTQAEVLAELANASACAGDHGRAKTLAVEADVIAHRISEPYQRSGTLAAVAIAYASAEGHSRAKELAAEAERVARAITNPNQQPGPMDVVVEAIAASGEYQRAEAVARGIADPYLRIEALVEVAAALTAAGERDRAEALASEAERIARHLTDPDDHAKGHAAVATALAVILEYRWAEETAFQITEPYWHVNALAAVAEALAAAGGQDRAQALAVDAEITARGMPEPYWQVRALADVVKALAAAGMQERAVALADEAIAIARGADPDNQVSLLVALTEALAAAGEHGIARDLADEAVGVVGAHQHQSPWTLAAVVTAMAAAGNCDRAQGLAGIIDNSEAKGKALSAVTTALVSAGEMDQASRIARSIADPGSRVQAMSAVAAALAATGKHAPATALATEAETVAYRVAGSFSQGEALATVAETLTGTLGGRHARRVLASALAANGWETALIALGKVDPAILRKVASEITLKGSSS